MNSNIKKEITGLNFNDGKKGYSVNGDENRIIYFNPSDVNLYDRVEKAGEEITSAIESLPSDFVNENPETLVVMETVKLAQEKIKKALNFMLDSDCYDAIFGNTSPLTPVNGELLINGVMQGLTELIIAESEKDMKALNKKLDKYRVKK